MVEDIGAVVDWIRQRTRAPKVALLGWGAGGHAIGQFATRRPDVVAAVVFYNTLYGGGPEHPLVGKSSDLADPARPGRVNRATLGAYRLYDAAAILKPWDQSIPGADKAAWRDPQVAAAYLAAVLAADPGAPPQRPPAVRVPTGPLADAFEVTTGRQAWDAGLVRAPALIVFSEKRLLVAGRGSRSPAGAPGQRRRGEGRHAARRDALRAPRSPGARASGADRCVEGVPDQERTSSGASTGGMTVR